MKECRSSKKGAANICATVSFAEFAVQKYPVAWVHGKTDECCSEFGAQWLFLSLNQFTASPTLASRLTCFVGENENLLHIGWPLTIVTATVIAVRGLGCQEEFCLQKTLRFQEVGDSQKWLHPHPAQS